MAVGDKLEIIIINGGKFQPIIDSVGSGRCSKCFFDLSGSCPDIKCMASERIDGNSVYFVKVESIVKSDTIKDIREKTQTLQKEIYNLVQAFESDTGMVVHGIGLEHVQEIGEASTTYNINLDVRLN